MPNRILFAFLLALVLGACADSRSPLDRNFQIGWKNDLKAIKEIGELSAQDLMLLDCYVHFHNSSLLISDEQNENQSAITYRDILEKAHYDLNVLYGEGIILDVDTLILKDNQGHFSYELSVVIFNNTFEALEGFSGNFYLLLNDTIVHNRKIDYDINDGEPIKPGERITHILNRHGLNRPFPGNPEDWELVIFPDRIEYATMIGRKEMIRNFLCNGGQTTFPETPGLAKQYLNDNRPRFPWYTDLY